MPFRPHGHTRSLRTRADADDASRSPTTPSAPTSSTRSSVVKGRALPDVATARSRCSAASSTRWRAWAWRSRRRAGPKPVKSARVVGDVLGRFHPHSDQAAYDALVRMAQDFSQRYPLIDGQGNFGSRDGDGAAAMRYTEARLAPIARLLLDEIDEGTVDFIPNYDGSTEEPRLLPARLPFVLLNGASGIAVGLATEIPSHNLREVAAAAVALMQERQARRRRARRAAARARLPRRRPDHQQRRTTSARPTRTRPRLAEGARALEDRGPGARPVAARRHRAAAGHQRAEGARGDRGAHQPEGQGRQEGARRRAGAAEGDACSRCSTRCATSRARTRAVRLVFEPKTRRIDAGRARSTTLLAHTSLESSAPINLTMVGSDGRPTQKSLRQMLGEWIALPPARRSQRRTRHRLDKVLDRIHMLEGRQLVLLNIDEVIRIIRAADEPKPALIERFALSERQADDILEIRLRQLARLEAIKIEQELKELRDEQAKLERDPRPARRR